MNFMYRNISLVACSLPGVQSTPAERVNARCASGLGAQIGRRPSDGTGTGMPIPRLQLFELEDQSWCPTVIRDLCTDYIHFIEITFRLHRAVVRLLAAVLRTTQSEHVIDLCSGGGGPIPALQGALAAEGLDLRFTLTDRFPNLPAFHRVEATSHGRITYVAHPVDARAVPKDLKGFRTIFNSFHHFRPTDAKAILRDAAEAGESIGIFEIPERSLLVILATLFTPLFVALATPFIRPSGWRRLFWTYVVPLVPLTCLWDGIVSQIRAYTVGELDRLTQDLAHDSYQWRTGQVAIPSTPGHVTYLLGYPQLQCLIGRPFIS